MRLTATLSRYSRAMAGSSQDLYRLSFAKPEERPEGTFWTLTFAPMAPASGSETDGDLVVTVKDATYQAFTSHETRARREEIEGMHTP